MRMRFAGAALVFLLFVTSAVAEDRLGVAVYPGAKIDHARTKLLNTSPAVRGAAYRTGDALDKVIAFYRKQGLLFLKLGEPSSEIARFKKIDTNVDVVVQNPWKDSQTGAIMKDTLIMIFKNEDSGSAPGTSI
jgi:hypothetical protein